MAEAGLHHASPLDLRETGRLTGSIHILRLPRCSPGRISALTTIKAPETRGLVIQGHEIHPQGAHGEPRPKIGLSPEIGELHKLLIVWRLCGAQGRN